MFLVKRKSPKIKRSESLKKRKTVNMMKKEKRKQERNVRHKERDAEERERKETEKKQRQAEHDHKIKEREKEIIRRRKVREEREEKVHAHKQRKQVATGNKVCHEQTKKGTESEWIERADEEIDIRKEAEAEAKRIENRSDNPKNPMDFVKQIASDISKQLLNDSKVTHSAEIDGLDDVKKSEDMSDSVPVDVDIEEKETNPGQSDGMLLENVSLQAVSQYDDGDNDADKGNFNKEEKKARTKPMGETHSVKARHSASKSRPLLHSRSRSPVSSQRSRSRSHSRSKHTSSRSRYHNYSRNRSRSRSQDRRNNRHSRSRSKDKHATSSNGEDLSNKTEGICY